MSERLLLVQTAGEIFASAASERPADGTWHATLWQTLSELGFGGIGVDADKGGTGGTFADAAAVVGVGAAHAIAVPLAESLLAAHVLGDAGVAPSTEPTTIAVSGGEVDITCGATAVHVKGRLDRVPWARACARLVVVGDGAPGPAVVDLAQCEIHQGENLAGEPRDSVYIDSDAERLVWQEGWSERRVMLAAAALRVAQLSGAVGVIRNLTIEHASQREQFGRPIASFQAVQQQLAGLVSIAAGVALAAEYAAAAPGDDVAVAASKAHVGRTAGDAASIAHRLHGAVGLTEEHPLNLLTRRVWAWREEFGNDVSWGRDLGARVLAAGEGAWDLLTADPGQVTTITTPTGP